MPDAKVSASGSEERMLTYPLDGRGDEPLYRYLYDCIRHDIVAGALAPETKLPSKRAFARNMGVSTITVENAYSQLVAEGYIYSAPQKGFYVADAPKLLEDSHLRMHPIDVGRLPHPEDVRSRFAVEPPPSSDQHLLVDFSSNQTDPDNFPFSTWARLMRRVIAEDRDVLMANSPAGGILELRQAICDHLHEFRGMSVAPEQVIVGAGTEYLYGLLLQLLGRDGVYAVEDPGYSKISKVYEGNGVVCRHIPLDAQGIGIASLAESGADIVHISPSHHYPTGIAMPISRRYELMAWAASSASRYIIEDDYDSEFRLAGRPIPSLQSIDGAGKVIYLNTFTKSLASTIRISYLVLPPALLERFDREMGFYACTVSNFEQCTLARFITQGYFEKHINRMRRHYRMLRDELLASIEASPLASKVTITEEGAGLHFLMRIDTGMPDEVLVRRARAQGVRISCLSDYQHHPDGRGEHVLVVNYSGIPAGSVEEAVACLARACGCPTR